MRRALSAVLLAIILLSSFVQSESFKNAKPSDYGLYSYFNPLLGNFSWVLSKIPGDEDLWDDVNVLWNVTNSTYYSVTAYSPLGIDPKALELSLHFKLLADSIAGFYSAKEGFSVSISQNDFGGARTELLSMKSYLSSIREEVNAIASVPLFDSGGNRLEFDFTGVYSGISLLEGLVGKYERLLNGLEAPSNFSLYAFPGEPFVFQNVTVYGYAPNISNVTVFVDGNPYAPNVTNDSFSLVLSFNETGNHSMFAEGINGSQRVRSNEVNLTVLRMPTAISALQSGNSVTGKLLDYFGNPLSGREIKADFGVEIVSVETNGEGNFTLKLPPLMATRNVSLYFSGDELYSPSNLTLQIIPPKKPLSLVLLQPERNFREGRVELKGYVNGTDSAVLVEVYVDGKLVDTKEVSGNFTVTLDLKAGTHTVYLRFPGNREFAEAISNAVQVSVVPYSYTKRLLLLSILLIAGFFLYRLSGRRKVEGVEGTGEISEVEEREGSELPDLIRSYRIVYNLLRRLYALPKSTTPRELLERFRGMPFFTELKKLTSLHERVRYGGRRLSRGEMAEGIRTAARVIVSVFVGDEL